jgi:prepilin-type N-terminal cleavage/methylation domain-containing protein
MRKKAFTLVELLVVVSIIALLIAMLAPSLQSAKDVVKAAYCKSTINALNKSVFVYAENNRGFMMVFMHEMYTGYSRAPDNPWKTYQCFNGTGIDPNTGVISDARGFGLVYAMKILYPAAMFYCPDPNPLDQRQNLDYYPKPWGTALGPGSSSTIRNSYMWNPWIMPNPAQSGKWAYEDLLMLGRHDNNRFLTSDLLDDWQSMRHMTTVAARWNMGFADGHVYTYESGKYPSTSLYNFFMQQVDHLCDCSQSWNDASVGYNVKVRPLLPQ